MTIPVESSEVLAFSPESLKEKMGDAAPVFRLKAPSERCVRRWRQMCEDDGLETFSAKEFDAEKLRAIDALWSEDDARPIKDRLTSIFVTRDQERKISADDLAWAEALDDKLFDNHRKLNVMSRKSREFNEYAPRYSLAVYLGGWSGIDVPFKLDGGVIPDETITLLLKELRAIGKAQLGDDGGSIPVFELLTAATRRINITEEEEKNSSAPLPPSVKQDASTATVQQDGQSSEESETGDQSSMNLAPTKTPAGE